MSVTTAEGLLSPVNAARWLDISRSQVYVLMADGLIPYVRIGNQRRIAVADLEAYVARLRADAGLDLLANSNVIGLSR